MVHVDISMIVLESGCNLKMIHKLFVCAFHAQMGENMYKYGYFNEDGSEYIVTNPATPRAFDNFLWNDSIFSNVQQTGVGYADYQINGTEGVQLFSGIGRICDFDTYGRDHLMSRLIYIRDNETGEYWNLNWEPVKKAYDSFQCIHGLGYTIIKTLVNGIESELCIFIPVGQDPVELWSLKTRNISGKARNLSVFVYNQFQFSFKWGFDSYGDMIYRSSYHSKDLNAIVASKHPHRRPHDYLTGYMTADETIAAFDGSRDAFVGIYSTLSNPDAVVRGYCSNTPGSAEATVGAAQFDMELFNDCEKKIELIIGATDNETNIAQVRNKYLGNFQLYLDELKNQKNEISNRNNINTPDKHMDTILNKWVKQATIYGATWCRWGWNGYRDIVQHGLGVSGLMPERTREIIISALKHQYSSGLALRGWNPIDEKAYSDSALWLVFTLIAYLKESGDFSILEETVPYYDGGIATVKQHINTALDFLESNKGSHGLVLIKYGDWNDSLTAIGKEGRGESVWLSIAYAEAMRQMAELSEFSGDVSAKNDYLQRYENIKEAINSNAWDGKWYLRCYDDNGRPIGSDENKYAKIFMEPQCWSLISGIADEQRAETLIKSCNEMLDTQVGYLLLAPTFKEIDDNIGRISSLEPGICENGTVYSHLNIWMILGLLKYGKADKAYELFKKITPGYIEGENSVKQNCPANMYANCYFGPDHRNKKFQMEFTWITGSVAWFNTTLLNHMIGARAEFNGLTITPCIPSEWEEYSVERFYRGCVYKINVKNPDHVQSGKVVLTVDGKKLDGNFIPEFNDNKTHIVDAVIKAV